MLAAAVANAVYNNYDGLVLRTSAEINPSTGVARLLYYYGGMGFISQPVSIAAGDDFVFWLDYVDKMADDVYAIWLKNSRPEDTNESN